MNRESIYQRSFVRQHAGWWLFVVTFFAGAAWGIEPWDDWLSARLSSHNLSGDLRRFLDLMEFFAHGAGAFIIVAAIYCLAPDYRGRLPRLILALLLTSLVVHVVKSNVVRVRPGQMATYELTSSAQSWGFTNPKGLGNGRQPSAELFSNRHHHFQSFPSGHSANVCSLAIGLTWLFGRGAGFFGVIALLGAAQRIFFAAHWPSDVLGGFAIATLVTGLVLWNAPRCTALATRGLKPDPRNAPPGPS